VLVSSKGGGIATFHSLSVVEYIVSLFRGLNVCTEILWSWCTTRIHDEMVKLVVLEVHRHAIG
jgi:hypothetical protein